MSSLDGHYCATCRYALDRVVDIAGARYEHTAAWHRDYTGPVHEPSPMPLIEMVEVNMFCDICSVDSPVWLYTFVPVTVQSGPRVEVISAGWSLCDKCADVAETRDVGRLIERAALGFADPTVVNLDRILRPVYSELLLNDFTREPRTAVTP